MRRLTLILSLWVCLFAFAQVSYSPDMLPLIMQDIYEQLVENGREPDFEELEPELLTLHENPINLNAATEDDLRRLRFLSDEQIDDILLFVYKQPLNSLYELRLIPSLADY